MNFLRSDPPIGDHIYKQYDGKYFMVLEIAEAPDGIWFVIYRNLADDSSYPNVALPFEVWYEPVNEDGKLKKRFSEIDPDVEFN